jgi:tRNA A37 N6-isopentenylltransferase MiaA
VYDPDRVSTIVPSLSSSESEFINFFNTLSSSNVEGESPDSSEFLKKFPIFSVKISGEMKEKIVHITCDHRNANFQLKIPPNNSRKFRGVLRIPNLRRSLRFYFRTESSLLNLSHQFFLLQELRLNLKKSLQTKNIETKFVEEVKKLSLTLDFGIKIIKINICLFLSCSIHRNKNIQKGLFIKAKQSTFLSFY